MTDYQKYKWFWKDEEPPRWAIKAEMSHYTLVFNKTTHLLLLVVLSAGLKEFHYTLSTKCKVTWKWTKLCVLIASILARTLGLLFDGSVLQS